MVGQGFGNTTRRPREQVSEHIRTQGTGESSMLTLDRTTVRLGAHPRDKEGAIREVGALLVDAGYITPQYIQSMLGRELQANTYLGNGIAIPHGMLEHKDAIRQTGI